MRRYYSKSASVATQKSYMAGNKQYVQFCQQSSLPCVPYLREDTATVCHLLGNWWFILCHHQSVLGSSLALIHDGRTPQYLRHSIHLQDPTFVKRHSQGICKASTSQKAPSNYYQDYETDQAISGQATNQSCYVQYAVLHTLASFM